MKIPRTLAAGVLVGAAAAQQPATQQPIMDAPTAAGFVERTVVVGGVERRYAVHVPRGYTPKRRWPLIVFLNGMGECGTDGTRQTTVGLGAAIRADEGRWPFVVAFPQKPDKQSQWSEHGGLVLAVMRDVEATWHVDAERRFLTGISQGGAGTWALGARHADLFAAIAPVCGYGKPDEVAGGLKGMPIWAFHGADDKVVPAQQSKALCAAVEALGGAPVLTIYEKTAHNSWDQAYRESNLAEWLRALPDHRPFATALARPETSRGLWLRLQFGHGRAIAEHVALGNPSATGEAPDWRLQIESGEQRMEPFGQRVAAERAAGCLGEAVRLLVRAGVLDRDDTSAPDSHRQYVEVDYSFGYGGRSVSAWPKRWKVDSSTTDLAAEIRRAADAMKQAR